MALITLEEAAARIGVPQETVEDWVKRGLLSRHERPSPSTLPPGPLRLVRLEQCVDEEQLTDVAESLGWLQLSADNWDNDEED
jgi:hypothetical protein